MVFNFGSEKYDRHLDKKLFFNLKGKEKEIYLRLKKKAPSENIIVSIGDAFSNVDYKNLDKESLKKILNKAKTNSVIWERKMIAAEDILKGIQKSETNPKVLLKIFFSDREGNIQKPYWELTRTLFSIMGGVKIKLRNSELKWFESIELKNKYATEDEILDPLFTILDTKKGHEIVKHLYNCKNAVCTCIEVKNGFNELINNAKEYRKEMEIEYFIFDSLGKENPNNVIGLIEKCMDMYWITRLYYVVKSTNAGIIKNRNGKIEENKNNEIK